MAVETWLIKVKTAISHGFDSVITSAPIPKASMKSNVGVLSFETAGLMSKLLHLWQSLSDKNISRLRNESISLEGVRKIVSNDESFLLGLACGEMAENLRFVAKAVSRLSKRCGDSNLSLFERLFDDFANSGRDTNCWVLNYKEMEAKNKKMDRYVTVTATLYKEMEELSFLENGLRKALQCSEHESTAKEQKIMDLQQKIFWQRQQVKYLKERSLWNRSFDGVVSMLVRSIFTVLARIKLVFDIGHGYPTSLPRSLSASATIHPTENHGTCSFVAGSLKSSKLEGNKDFANGFFETNSKLLKPPETTLGAAAFALHYANLIIVMEKMIRSPQLVGVDARDDLYSMLPNSIRSLLRARLKGVGFSASDPVLAGEWKDALGRILGWLSPLAHNMIKWQSERSFEQQNLLPKTNVLLLQTLFFANKEKTEAAITELLVGLNYIWRFEREMTAKALFECSNFNGLLNSKSSS
ncbi:hypothetical protein P3X46_030660 [Hevea brasiliensis]|uniref:DUF668 domain-containing protein n=1 Tax=Hevea brasiliensis TaxID=3981 RepID=A0ABQ9KJK8_HEVBR|nr:protein PSK SIMULATOR 1 [Hevea brasiliensis]KAJ9139969.1 hypothetical protein P3X46_030660 [Hevea brasiliensis]